MTFRHWAMLIAGCAWAFHAGIEWGSFAAVIVGCYVAVWVVRRDIEKRRRRDLR